jgi:hypothetical protein
MRVAGSFAYAGKAFLESNFRRGGTKKKGWALLKKEERPESRSLDREAAGCRYYFPRRAT